MTELSRAVPNPTFACSEFAPSHAQGANNEEGACWPQTALVFPQIGQAPSSIGKLSNMLTADITLHPKTTVKSCSEEGPFNNLSP